MAILDLAIRRWGFEDPRTVAIAILEENGCSPEFVAEMFETLAEDEEED